MSKRVQPATVGAFVLGGVGLTLVLAIILGSGALFRDTLTLVSFFDGEVAGLVPGSPVSYRGVTIGSVKEVRIALEGDRRPVTDTRIPVIYDLDLTTVRRLARSGGGDLRDPTALDYLIDSGFRAKLESESLVTGRKVIVLGIFPDVADTRMDPTGVPFPEIPTHPNTMDEIQDRVLAAAEVVSQMDLVGVVENLNAVLVSVNDLVSSEELGTVAKELEYTLESFADAAEQLTSLAESFEKTGTAVAEGLDQTFENSARTMASIDTTLTSLRQMMDPDAPLSFRLERTLRELESAARAIRGLAEYLEMNPSALLKGRSGSEDDS
jgi:paraquat-inducible protein B